MASRSQLSPRQLVLIAVLGNLVFASVFFLGVPLDRWMQGIGIFGRLLFVGLFFAVGMMAALTAESRFRNGVRSNQWSEEEIAPLREVLLSGLWTVFSISSLIASAVLMFVAAHHYRGIGWGLLTMGQSLTRLQIAFRLKTPKNPGGPSWPNFAPIRSEHWGER